MHPGESRRKIANSLDVSTGQIHPIRPLFLCFCQTCESTSQRLGFRMYLPWRLHTNRMLFAETMLAHNPAEKNSLDEDALYLHPIRMQLRHLIDFNLLRPHP